MDLFPCFSSTIDGTKKIIEAHDKIDDDKSNQKLDDSPLIKQKLDDSPSIKQKLDDKNISNVSLELTNDSEENEQAEEESLFVFRSRPIPTCPYHPLKVVVFIASAEGYHHTEALSDIDPRLSNKGVRKCKFVQNHLKSSSQQPPDVMYCSTLYRALSTMRIVCSDWYDDKPSIGFDALRPKYEHWNSNHRSPVETLSHAFKKVSFEHIAEGPDPFCINEIEDTQTFHSRIKQFVASHLMPKSELELLRYGLDDIVYNQPNTKNNYNNNDSRENSYSNDNGTIINKNKDEKKKINVARRLVVVTNRHWLDALFNDVFKDSSEQLQMEWKHCDLRKVFIYSKYQLGLLCIPSPLMQPIFIAGDSNVNNNSNNYNINKNGTKSKFGFVSLKPIHKRARTDGNVVGIESNNTKGTLKDIKTNNNYKSSTRKSSQDDMKLYTRNKKTGNYFLNSETKDEYTLITAVKQLHEERCQMSSPSDNYDSKQNNNDSDNHDDNCNNILYKSSSSRKSSKDDTALYTKKK